MTRALKGQPEAAVPGAECTQRWGRIESLGEVGRTQERLVVCVLECAIFHLSEDKKEEPGIGKTWSWGLAISISRITLVSV